MLFGNSPFISTHFNQFFCPLNDFPPILTEFTHQFDCNQQYQWTFSLREEEEPPDSPGHVSGELEFVLGNIHRLSNQDLTSLAEQASVSPTIG